MPCPHERGAVRGAVGNGKRWPLRFTTQVDGPSGLEKAGRERFDVALGRSHRTDPVLGSSGGPAGNGRLTAWTGLVLLVLFVAELITLLDVRALINWHLALGVILVPPASLKTATTGWRTVRYYNGHEPYRQAGPPPVLLRVLGPLVIVGNVALLATGVALVLLGERSSQQTLIAVLGLRVDTLTLHQGAFAAWAVVMGLHVLARIWPAWQMTRPARPRVPGGGNRGVALLAILVLSVAFAGWVLTHQNGWDSGDQPPRPAGKAIAR